MRFTPIPVLLLISVLAFSGLFLVLDHDNPDAAASSTHAPSSDPASTHVQPQRRAGEPTTAPPTPTGATLSPSSAPAAAPAPNPPGKTTGDAGAETLSGAEDPDIEPSGDLVAPGRPAVPRDARQEARFEGYEQVAVEFMTAFARPPSEQAATWWDRVGPYLSERVRSDYQGVDPAAVPFTEVTGPGVVVPIEAPSDLLMVVLVPTDAGDYHVEMETDEAGIHVTRVVPPRQDGAP